MESSKPTTIKSSIAAGLFGIFLGGFGAHDWYLGNKKNGLIHIILFSASFVIITISSIMTALTVFSGLGFLTAIFGFICSIAYIVMMGNYIWGLVEGIILLVQGDAGLAAKGYTIATAAAPAPAPEAPAQPAAKKSTPKTSK